MNAQRSNTQMPQRRADVYHHRIGVHDILFTLFKHKRLLLVCTFAGLIAGAAIFLFYPAVYESRAKLLVRYVVERSAVDGVDTAGAPMRRDLGLAAIASEVEILTSWDLAQQVAAAIGPKRLLPDSKQTPTPEAAAAVVAKGLDVKAVKGGNILFVSYRNSDPQIAIQVLEELVSRYFVKHLEVHRSAGAFDFVTQQTDQVRARLNQTEDALKPLKERAGIVSLAESRTGLAAELSRTQQELHDAETEFAEQQARVKQLDDNGMARDPGLLGPSASATPSPTTPEPSAVPDASPTTAVEVEKPSSNVIQQYQVIVSRLGQLRQNKLDLLAKYTDKSPTVELTQKQIDGLEADRARLEHRFPQLTSVPRGSVGRQSADLVTERARLAGLAAKLEALQGRLRDVQGRVKQLSELEPQIAELERKKELEETNYKYFQGSLEKSRIDEALDPSKIPNISAVQKPSAPGVVTGPRNKLAFGIAGGSIALGLLLALLSDLVLNRTVKRGLELERQLQTPVLLSIPYFTRNGARRALTNGSGKELERARGGDGANGRRNGATVAPWDQGHFIRPYCEAIRDRIGLYFELNNLTHKPKLVGVTGYSREAGASTMAAGLAAALSETDEGKVLLVDVNLGPGDVHPFFKGKPAYSLATALQTATEIDPAAENLYLATVGSTNAGPAQLGLKRFFDMMPNLKASDFDYIIFDMPPLEQTSPTWGMAAFMDKLLLVVEANATDRDVVRRGYNRLLAGRDNVAVVFNKARSCAPEWLRIDD